MFVDGTVHITLVSNGSKCKEEEWDVYIEETGDINGKAVFIFENGEIGVDFSDSSEQLLISVNSSMIEIIMWYSHSYRYKNYFSMYIWNLW